VVKAQVLSGGRGKAGGVKVVSSPDEAAAAAKKILGMTIGGSVVGKVLVAEAADIRREFYMSVVVNRSAKRAEFVFSRSGGVDIEETAAAAPEKIRRVPLDPVSGMDPGRIRDMLGADLGNGVLLERAVSIALNMGKLFADRDCTLVEVNPLAQTGDGNLVAVDAKIIIDDNAAAGRPDLEELRNAEEYSDDEIEARSANLSFVSLEGDIGCMVNGAGLAMATMDLIMHFGGRPANFLDIGGSSNPQKVVDAVRILLRNENLKAILMNIFGGITRCDDVARGVIRARGMIDIPVPFVIRLIGTNDEAGRAMLEEAGLSAYSDLAEAVQRVVEESKGRGAA